MYGASLLPSINVEGGLLCTGTRYPLRRGGELVYVMCTVTARVSYTHIFQTLAVLAPGSNAPLPRCHVSSVANPGMLSIGHHSRVDILATQFHIPAT